MENCQKRPCMECPFRRESWPGFLGGFTIEETISAALSEESFQCHMTRIDNDNGYTGKPKECAGRLLFATKTAKMFRDKELEEMRKEVKELNPDYQNEVLGFDLKQHHVKQSHTL